MSVTKLEQDAIALRAKLLPKNFYNNETDANNYSATHTRALSDNQTPTHGKGTGANTVDGAAQDFDGGDVVDRLGSTRFPESGRVRSFAQNLGKWGYDYGHKYYRDIKIDTSGNKGQVILGE